jgi:hypothetical protein
MKKFEKLSRAEMKKITAGKFNACPGGSCLLPGDCQVLGGGCTVGPGGVFGQYTGSCIACTCPGGLALQCSPAS